MISDDSGFKDCNVPKASLLRVLQGVAIATKTLGESSDLVAQWISRRTPPSFGRRGTVIHGEAPNRDRDHNTATALSLDYWRGAIESDLPRATNSRQLASLALGIAFLRAKSRLGPENQLSPKELTTVWQLIHRALTSLGATGPLCNVSRSAQGFLAIPLCSLPENGNINKLFRLHVY